MYRRLRAIEARLQENATARQMCHYSKPIFQELIAKSVFSGFPRDIRTCSSRLSPISMSCARGSNCVALNYRAK